MTISNRISLDDLPGLPVGEIAALPGDDLALLKQEADERLRAAKNLCDWIDGAIALKYGERAQEARRAAGRDTGTVRFRDGPVTVVAELPKRVEWDQEELARIKARIAEAGEDSSEFIDTRLSVSERRFSALPESWRKGFEPARTVRTGKPKFRLLIGEEVR